MLLVISPIVRAPRSDNQDLCIPDHDRLCDLAVRNAHGWQSKSIPEWITKLRHQARVEVTESIKDYTASYLDARPVDPSMLWILGGHQPEAFHPGVWYKNFLVDATSKALRANKNPALGLHVIVDHDLPKSLSIKVPHLLKPSNSQQAGVWINGLESHLSVATCQLPIQSPHEQVASIAPWHRYQIDPNRIDAFVQQVESSASSLNLAKPLAREFFDLVRKSNACHDAAIAFSQARHLLELQHGIGNVDLPMSKICQTHAWFAFVEYCISQAGSLFDTYNGSLEAYRAREKITNPGQPVAPLARQADWFELPFWLYRSSDPSRNRMWVRIRKTSWELASGSSPEQFAWTIHTKPQCGGLQAAIEQRFDEGICLRPRALMTTLFLRCFLADGFVHGIGGGIYDRLTDEIIRSFLGVNPPGYAIATATLHLPVPDPLKRTSIAAHQDLVHLQGVSRTLRSAPQTHLLEEDPQQRLLAKEHAELLANIPPRGRKKEWHRKIVDVKTRILRAIDPLVQSHQLQLQTAHQRAHEARLLGSREYSMLLFPKTDCIERLKVLASRVRA